MAKDKMLRVRVDSGLKKRLSRIAKDDGRSLSDLVRLVLIRYVEREEQALASGKKPGAFLQEMAVPYAIQN